MPCINGRPNKAPQALAAKNRVDGLPTHQITYNPPQWDKQDSKGIHYSILSYIF